MKKKCILSLIITSLFFSGCSSSYTVTKYEFDAVVAERDNLSTQLENARSELKDLENQLNDEKENLDNAKAWAKNALDDGAQCAITEDHRLLVIVQTSYEATSDSVTEIVEKSVSATQVYQYSITANDKNKFNEITILYKDKQGKYLIGYSFKPGQYASSNIDIFGTYDYANEILNDYNSEE